MRPMLGTLWRGALSRRTLSLGCLVLIALAVGAALMGPSMRDAVTRSFIVTRLNESPNTSTAVSWVFRPAQPDLTTRQAAALAVSESAKLTSGPWADPQVSWETERIAVPPGDLGGDGGEAMLLAATGACDNLELVSGRCPEEPGEAVMLDADLATTGFQVGETRTLGELGDVRLVGTYEAPVGESDFWVNPGRLGTRPRYVNETTGLVVPYQPGPFVVTEETVDGVRGVQVRVDRRLEVPPDFEERSLDDAATTAEQMDADNVVDTGVGVLTPVSVNNLPTLRTEFAAQQDAARASISPAVLSLSLVALALLMRLLSAAAELRVPELSLASLRGLSRRQMWFLGLAEPLSLLLVGIPVGVLLGVLMSWSLIRAWLVPGLPLPLPAGSLLAALAVALAAALVCVLAVGTVLRHSLAGQLGGVRRPASTHGAVVLLELGLVAAAVVVLATKLSGGGEQSQPDATDLVLPVLLGIVAGLIATRLAALAARALTRRRNRSLAFFVSSRAVARRQEGTLVILPIAVAVAVGVFSLGVHDAAANWRSSVAATAAPADTVWQSPQGARATYDLVQRLDPEGRSLMTASRFAAFGGLVAVVDTPRMERVMTWDPAWTEGRTAGSIADAIGPPQPRPFLLGTRLTVGADLEPGAGAEPDEELFIELRLQSDDGAVRGYLGPLRSGPREYDVRLPECVRGCSLDGFNVGRRAGLPATFDHRLTLTSLTVDGSQVPGALGASWVEAPDIEEDGHVVDVLDQGDRLDLRLDSNGVDSRARLTSAGVPVFRPLTVGVDAGGSIEPSQRGNSLKLSADRLLVEDVGSSESVPFYGPKGLMVDYTMLATDRPLYDAMMTNLVLARGDTPASMEQALADQGMTVLTTRAAQQRSLDQGAYALALRLYVVVAVLVLLMALAGLAVSMAVQLPSRRRDAAALRVVGVRRLSVMAAVAGEFVGVLGAAVLAGIAAGTIAQDIVLRTITLGQVEDMATPHLITRVDSGRLALTVLVAVVLLGLAGWISSALTVRGARGSTLRENAR